MLLLAAGFTAFGADFGLVLGITPEYGTINDDAGDFVFTGTMTPWISGVLQEGLSYYASGRLTAEYEDGEMDPLLFEVERTELTWRPLSRAYVSFGRQPVKDSAEMIVSGLFDGVNGAFLFDKARLSLGVYYTGLLYKESAAILLTKQDYDNYHKSLDYGDGDSYSASRRFLFAVTGEFPDLTSRTFLALNGLAQFDLNGQDSLHSQYLLGHYFFTPIEPLTLNLAASVEFIEEQDLQLGFAVSGGADWEPPSALQDMLSARIRWSSGATSDFLGAFLPLNGISQGEIFTPRISALMSLNGSYTVRLHSEVSAAAGAAYFIRTDRETYFNADLDPGSSSPFLGAELYASAAWAPESAIRLTLEGGAFFPGLGGAFYQDTPVQWKISTGITLSL